MADCWTVGLEGAGYGGMEDWLAVGWRGGGRMLIVVVGVVVDCSRGLTRSTPYERGRRISLSRGKAF